MHMSGGGNLRSNAGARVHILGIGNIGRLFAHGLAIDDPPPHITLLLHRVGLAESWETGGRAIEIITDGVSSKSSGYGIEVIGDNNLIMGEVIDNLIVATKATNTAAAILAIRPRLRSSSTILFAQNGMGVVDEVSRKVFPDVASRPRYLACVTSHGMYSQGPFTSVHAGFGTVTIGRVASQDATEINESVQFDLVEAILKSPVLDARAVSADELIRLQIEKLVVNAMINPLTVIFNRRNGELFTNTKILSLMRLLLQEASDVIRSLPELQNDPAAQQRFSTARLENIVLDVAKKTAKNTSSMLQDVKAGRQTEIDYINGYIVSRGTQVGIDCRHNRTLLQLVKETRTVSEDEIKELF
jgi:2-dehydropantoate 2-reductase